MGHFLEISFAFHLMFNFLSLKNYISMQSFSITYKSRNLYSTFIARISGALTTDVTVGESGNKQGQEDGHLHYGSEPINFKKKTKLLYT